MTIRHGGFNTQPPEGGWRKKILTGTAHGVSTHSRPKAAGFTSFAVRFTASVSTHSRPKAAAGAFDREFEKTDVSTHSRPKAAGLELRRVRFVGLFQHTAARRRLQRHKSRRT